MPLTFKVSLVINSLSPTLLSCSKLTSAHSTPFNKFLTIITLCIVAIYY